MKSWCIWCESENHHSKKGYYWIHLDCAEKLMDMRDLTAVKEILQGIHTRNKDDEDKLTTVYKFIKDMEDFHRKWDGTMKIIRGTQNVSQM